VKPCLPDDLAIELRHLLDKTGKTSRRAS
jgi:hypothetical protein